MKTDRFVGYLAPQVDVVKVSTEGILCASPDGFGINDMEVKQGGAGTDWDWE